MNCPIESRESSAERSLQHDLLMAYCSRKLDAARAAVLEDHIEICPACRKFAENQRAVWEALDGWEAGHISADFDRRLYQRIEKEVSWWDMLIRPFRPILFRQGLPITAAAAVVLVAGIMLERPSSVPLPGAPETMLQADVNDAEHALQEMELMREFNALVRPEPGDPKL